MVKLIKIPGEQNPSDVLTKYVKSEVINKFLDRLGIEYRTTYYNLSSIFINPICIKNDYKHTIIQFFKYLFYVVSVFQALWNTACVSRFNLPSMATPVSLALSASRLPGRAACVGRLARDTFNECIQVQPVQPRVGTQDLGLL